MHKLSHTHSHARVSLVTRAFFYVLVGLPVRSAHASLDRRRALGGPIPRGIIHGLVEERKVVVFRAGGVGACDRKAASDVSTNTFARSVSKVSVMRTLRNCHGTHSRTRCIHI